MFRAKVSSMETRPDRGVSASVSCSLLSERNATRFLFPNSSCWMCGKEGKMEMQELRQQSQKDASLCGRHLQWTTQPWCWGTLARCWRSRAAWPSRLSAPPLWRGQWQLQHRDSLERNKVTQVREKHVLCKQENQKNKFISYYVALSASATSLKKEQQKQKREKNILYLQQRALDKFRRGQD